ncbi:hypothetical protein NUACC21_82340 [Scytonema sp. NUACC21]
MTSINEQEASEKLNHTDGEVVLSVNGVSKKFCRDLKQSLFYGVQDIISEVLGLREKSDKLRPQEFWALKDVNFQLRRGEALGLVGKNGSGKSTLLRIIAGLIKPDAGFVEVNGRLAPLIALGAGFNPILTGRENIYTNMSILGLSEKEIKERFDEVVEFAEIGDAIDAPVQSYSSGMAARLGFSCAVHTDPDILLIDEVLSVGDARFRAKCQRKLGELRKNDVSFILVSHKSYQLMSICEKSVYLSKGQFISFGDTNYIIHQYEEDLFEAKKPTSQAITFLSEKPESRNIGFSLTYIKFQDEQGQILDSLITGESANLCLGFQAYRKIENINIRFKIKDLSGEGNLLYLSNWNDNTFFNLPPGKHELQIQLPYVGLVANYYHGFLLIREGPIYTLEIVEDFRFTVHSEKNMSDSMFYQPCQWKLL